MRRPNSLTLEENHLDSPRRAEAEVEVIKILPPRTEVLTGTDATEQVVSSRLGNHGVLHFATYGSLLT
jgi:CHAT domain-containing protein